MCQYVIFGHVAEFGDSRILVYMPLAERGWAMKSRAICMGIIILVAIVVFCVTPYSYWNADKMLSGALYCNLAIVMISILILYLFNRNDVKAVAKTIFISLSTYLQILVGFFLYQYGLIYCLLLLVMQILLGLAIMKSALNYKSIVVISSNLLASTIWAHRIYGFMYYSNISSDLETIGVSSLITAIGAVMASVISIFCISSYKQSDETDR